MTTSLFVILLTVYHCVSAMFFIYKKMLTPFKAKLQGDELIVDLLQKRLLISQRQEVWQFGKDRPLWVEKAKQCLRDTE